MFVKVAYSGIVWCEQTEFAAASKRSNGPVERRHSTPQAIDFRETVSRSPLSDPCPLDIQPVNGYRLVRQFSAGSRVYSRKYVVLHCITRMTWYRLMTRVKEQMKIYHWRRTCHGQFENSNKLSVLEDRDLYLHIDTRLICLQICDEWLPRYIAFLHK